ncbi:MAG: hypothetical protein L0H78_18005 [Humibacillus sp.]|nr:hypothetical protein [Humibacillus sp.]
MRWSSAARLALSQTAQLTSDPGGDGLPNEGDAVTYRFTVTNTGAVVLRSVRVNNALLKRLGSTISCASTTVAPKSSTTCVSTPLRITRTQAMAGKTVSKAGASALTLSGEVVRSNSTQTTLTVLKPNASGSNWIRRDGNGGSGGKSRRAFAKLSMTQSLHSVVDNNKNAVLDRGDSVRYAFTITNVGSVPVSGIRVADTKLAKLKVNIRCASVTLAPGQSTACVSAPLVLTDFQARAGIGANFATGQGTALGVIVKSNLTSMSVPKRIAGAQPAVAAAVAPLDFGEGLFSAGPSEVSALSDADRTAASLTKTKTNFDSGTLGMLGGGLLAGGLLLASVTKVVVKRRKPVIHLPGSDS